MQTFITTVTQKGQITLPAEFRRQLGVSPFSRVQVSLSKTKDSVKVKPAQDVLDLAGTFKPRKNQRRTTLEAREAFEKNYHRA